MVNRYVFYADGTIRMHSNIAHERGVDLSIDLTQIESDYEIKAASVLTVAHNGPRKLHVVGEEEQDSESPNANASTFLCMFLSENKLFGASRGQRVLRGTVIMFEDVLRTYVRQPADAQLLPLRLLARSRNRYKPIASIQRF